MKLMFFNLSSLNPKVLLILNWVPRELALFRFLGSAKRSIMFQWFRDLKKVEKQLCRKLDY